MISVSALRSHLLTLSFAACSTLLLGACATGGSGSNELVPTPRYAAHQHLISPGFGKVIDQPEQ